MRKVFSFLVVLILIIGAVIIYRGGSAEVPAQGVATSTPKTIISGVPDIEYDNMTFSFSIVHPESMTASPSDPSAYLPMTASPVVSFVVPSSMMAGTNLSEAGVYIGATTTPAIVASCTKVSVNGVEQLTGTSTINGADFATFTSADPGAGNLYEEKIYRRVQGSACIEIAELLHSANIGNYDPGTVVAFDRAEFTSILESVAMNYKQI